MPFRKENDNNNSIVSNEKTSTNTTSSATKQDERQCLIRKLDPPKKETKSDPNNEIGYELHTLYLYCNPESFSIGTDIIR